MKAPQWLHRKIAAIPGFFWRKYCKSQKAAKQEALRQKLEAELETKTDNPVLKELARAGMESQIRMEEEIDRRAASIRGFVE